ncbi:MAG: translational GTPase TypA [Desulfovibrio sp.]|nr:MAG: translational GTPase TypA [Desulfovibrio sp.]
MSESKTNPHMRNVAIIAHVDHGKTTLVDAMFRQSGLFREDQEVSRVMDSMDLERERGITIAAKNCSVVWKDVKVNIIDTPGHADFGGEVERSLSMADGALLLVDASEGPLPQTRFVLKKTFEAGLKVIVVINKIDRKDARPQEVLDEIYDLFIDLDADEEQLEFPVFYAIGREGVAQKTLADKGENLDPLMDALIEELPAPGFDLDAPFRMLVADLSYSDYLGRLAIGRVLSGRVKSNDSLVVIGEDSDPRPLKVSKLQNYQGPQLNATDQAGAGDIVVLAGVDEVSIGDTICTADVTEPLPRIRVDEPTVSMLFSINTSPLAGREGKNVQYRKLRDRLFKEALRNVSLKVEEQSGEGVLVKGRGEFQLCILIETMRREDFELCVGRPTVILKQENGKTLEPMEHLFIDCDEGFMGVVTEKLSNRKGRMVKLSNKGSGRVRLEFSIPSRGVIGYRDEFLTDTKGTGILNSSFAGYDEYRGDFPSRFTGSLVCDRPGNSVAYALFNLEPRGRLFIPAGVPVYEGMIVGEHNRANDLDVNATKEKKLTNIRAAGKDEAVTLSPVLPMTLEQAVHFIRDDEMVEITPESIRLRKVELSATKRHTQRGSKLKNGKK